MRSQSRTGSYIAGLSTGYMATVATILVGLWLTPFALRYLDREEYAILTLSSDAIMWLGLLDLGMSAGMGLKAAQLSGRPQQERLNSLASTTWFAQLILMLTLLVVGGCLAFIFPHFFGVRRALQQQATAVVAVMVIDAAVALGVRVFSSLLVAYQMVYVDNLIKLAILAVRTGLAVVLLITGWGILSVAIAALAADCVTSVLAVWRVRRLLPTLELRWKHVSWDVLRATGGLGLWFSLGSVSGIIIQNLDRIVTAKVISLDMVTTLALTGRVYALTWGLLQQITNTARPMLGQLFGRGKYSEALRTYRQLFALSTGGAVVGAFALWSANASFVRWWVGSSNYSGWLVDFGLALNLIANLWVLPNRATLSAALAFVPHAVVCRIVEAALNISLSVLLGLRFGLLGIVLSTSVASLLVSCWYMPWLTAKLFNRPFWRFLREDSIRIIAVGLIMLPLALGLRDWSQHLPDLLGAVFAGGLTSVVGLALLWAIGFDRALRGRLSGLALRAVKFGRDSLRRSAGSEA